MDGGAGVSSSELAFVSSWKVSLRVRDRPKQLGGPGRQAPAFAWDVSVTFAGRQYGRLHARVVSTPVTAALHRIASHRRPFCPVSM